MQPEGDATLRVRRSEVGPDDVVAELERLVVELGLAEEPVFVPASVVLAGAGAKPGRTDVEVRRPDGTFEGMLRCVPHDDEALRRVGILADHAGTTIQLVGRLRDAEHREAMVRRIAERLQDALLPQVPDVTNSTIAVAYRPAARDAKVGGDFYDVFPLPGGRVLLAIGDVMGKGVEAAAQMSLITQTLRALALAGLDLDVLLDRLDEQVMWQDTELMATVWCGLYEPGTGELAFASLGHPPALLLRAEGDPIRLELEGLPLGAGDLADQPPEVRTRRLANRDLLVLYTDGVVEASKDLLAGQEALLTAVKRRREEPVGDILNGVLDDVLGEAAHSDDAAMLVLRRG